MNNKEQAKIYYNKYQWQTIPCNGKLPTVPWKDWETKRIPIEKIEEWWTENPNANIGAITGALSGIVVLDIDGADVSGLHLPPTATATTNPGHFHYYFKHPGFHVSTTAGQLAKGLDFRGDGGFIVLPPSQHFDKETGKPDVLYTWLLKPSIVGFADMPQWLLDQVKEKKWKELGESFDFESAFQVVKGKRDDRLYRAACSLLAKRIPSKLTYQFLVFLNSTYKPPLEDEVVKKKFIQAIGFVTGEETNVEL